MPTFLLQELRKIRSRILTLAKDTPLQTLIRIKRGLLARFANNGVHQNGFQDFSTYLLRAQGKEGPVFAESNDFSESGIRSTLARLKEIVPNPTSSTERSSKEKIYDSSVKEYFSFSLERIPETARAAIEEAVQLIRPAKASANGYFSAYERFFYLCDSTGFEAFHPATAFRFGVTLTKGAGRGYLSFYHPDSRKLRVTPVVREAMQLAEEASRGEITLESGPYECIFSPRAFLELIEPLRRHFDRRFTEGGRSVFSGVCGKKVFSDEFTLTDDIGHPGQFGVPFDAEGYPKKKVALVTGGILKELLAEGHSTRGILEHPFYPQNLVVEKGNLSLKDLFRCIRRGIYINKIWYHTLVRESEMEVTGLATAGSVYIERGKIKGRVVHLRYHDSLFSILNSVVGTSREQILLKDGEMGAALFPYVWVSSLKIV